MKTKILLLIPIFCFSTTTLFAHKNTSERTKILQLCLKEFGPSVDQSRNLFDVNQAFVLQVTFDRRNKLSELAIEPKYFFNETHPEWTEPDSFPLLSWDEFKTLVQRLDGLKPKGQLTKPVNTIAFVTNSTGYYREYYERALLEWGEVGIRGEPDDGIRFFSLNYAKNKLRPRPDHRAAPVVNLLDAIYKNREDSVVYATAISAIFPKMEFFDKPIKQFVFENKTTIEGYDGPGIKYRDVSEIIPGTTVDTKSDFVTKNAERHPLGELKGLPVKYSLMDTSEMNGQFPLGSWRRFYETYPDSAGLLSLSMIGYSNNGEQALVYIAHAQADDGGSGYLFLLKKINNHWKVQNEEIVWVWVP